MIHLITGRPGHGKNIYSLHWLESQGFIIYDKETKKFNSTIDRPLFFIAFSGVDIIDSTVVQYEALDGLPINQDHANESVFPEGSVVVIDEAHLYSPKSTNREGFTGFVSFLKIHRHYGFDFVFITQSQKDLNIDIRNLVENHYRVNRPFGTSKSFVNHYLGCETSENKQPLKQSSTAFKIDPRFFDVYKSASIHNYKSSIPKKYWVFILLFLLFIGFVGSKAYYAYQMFISDNAIGFGVDDLVGSDKPASKERDASQIVSTKSDEPLFPYFYRFKNKSKFIDNQDIFRAIGLVVITNDSIFCNCSKKQIKIIDSIVKILDRSINLKLDFILVTFNKKDFLDFSLKYSFSSGHFSLNKGLDLISNLFLMDYLKEDYNALIKINSSAFVEAGRSFTANFVTKYPTVLRDFSGSNLNAKGSPPAVGNVEKQDEFGLVSETINYNDVGFKFKILTEIIDNYRVGITLNQSHSFLRGFVGEIPIIDKRDFNSHFLLKHGQLIPLFNLSSFLNSKSKTSSIPFFDSLFPESIDNNNSNYQVFLRFRFAGIKLKSKVKRQKKLISKVQSKKELISKPKDDKKPIDNNHSFKIRKDTKQALPAVSSIKK